MHKRIKRRNKRIVLSFGLIILIAAVGYVIWVFVRPVPPLKPAKSHVSLSVGTSTSSINWPAIGESAVGILGSDVLETHNSQSQLPTASTAKVLAALTILQAKPLQLDDQGPIITLGQSDVDIYNAYVAEDGSVVQVVDGEQISEYQALEAMLLPSANNMADSLAIWAFGSLPAYKTAADAYLSSHNIKDTTVGADASGYLPSTTSTAQDLIQLGELAMQNPVLAQIVGQSTASNIPVVGNISNVNNLLGTDGIIGLKTGNSDQAGGVFVSAANVTVDNKAVTILTSIMDAPDLSDALNDSLPLIDSAEANFKPVTVVKADSVVGYYRSPYNGESLPVLASKDLNIDTWNGAKLTAESDLHDISSSTKSGQVVGTLTVGDTITGNHSSVNLILGTNLVKPKIWQRLIHPGF